MSYPVKAVVFDWAGTMVDFGCRAPVRALIETFEAAGLAIDEAEARRDMGKAKRDHVAALLAQPSVRSRWSERFGRAPGAEDVERIYALLELAMEAAAARSAQLIPGAAQVVAELRARGVKIGSGTGYTRAMMAPILQRAAEQGYTPDVVVCAGETPSGRPAPLMTWQALIALDAWPAGACVKVDDAPVGIEEGRAAGCWTVGLAGSGNGVGLDLDAWRALEPGERARRLAAAEGPLREAGADMVVEDVSQLVPVIEEIARRIAAGQRPGG